jgi:hypothetical protein
VLISASFPFRHGYEDSEVVYDFVACPEVHPGLRLNPADTQAGWLERAAAIFHAKHDDEAEAFEKAGRDACAFVHRNLITVSCARNSPPPILTGAVEPP